MTNAKRGRGSHRAVYFCAVAALGLALSGCGGSGSSSMAPTADGSVPQSTVASASGASGSSTTPANGLTINWVPPTENVDGTTLTNLAGYNIHYGTASGSYSQVISVSNPGIANYVVQNLSAGTYYIAISAVNSAGMESPLSAEVRATVN